MKNLESFCDLLTDELTTFEADRKILSNGLKVDVNLIETVSVTLIIEFRKICQRDHSNLSVFQKNNNLTWREYVSAGKWWVTSLAKFVLSQRKHVGQNRVCFFEYYPHNLPVLTSVLTLSKQHDEYFIISLRDSVFKKLSPDQDRIASDSFGPTDFLSTLKINKIVNQFVDIFFSDVVSRNYSENFSEFKPVLSYLLKRQIFSVLRYYKQYDRMVNYLKPKKILFTTDSQANIRLVIQLCKKRGISSIVIQHGLIPDSNLLSLMITDTYLVWGEYYKQLIAKYSKGVRSQVLGSMKHAQIVREFGNIDSDQSKILFATSPPSGTSINKADYERVFNEVWKVAKQRPALHFYIKLHPSENANFVSQLMEKKGELGNFHLLAASADTYHHIATSAVVIFVSSTVSLEALLLNRPVICINFNFFKALMPYHTVTGYFEVENENTLATAIDRAIEINLKNCQGNGVDYFCLKSFKVNEAVKEIF